MPCCGTTDVGERKPYLPGSLGKEEVECDRPRLVRISWPNEDRRRPERDGGVDAKAPEASPGGGVRGAGVRGGVRDGVIGGCACHGIILGLPSSGSR